MKTKQQKKRLAMRLALLFERAWGNLLPEEQERQMEAFHARVGRVVRSNIHVDTLWGASDGPGILFDR